MTATVLKRWKCFDGQQYVYSHPSTSTGTDMQLAIYVPAHEEGEKLSVIVFLSGLTCTWENFTTKAGAQRYAADHKVILVMPDTSPRGPGVPDDEAYDLGQGAGFYVDATAAPWDAHFKMYSYINVELPDVIASLAPADMTRVSIMGHSMGGHGALLSALRNPEKYKSVSAIAPVASATKASWGPKVLTAYLGPDQLTWGQYDATLLVADSAWDKPILIDQGADDEFLEKNLKPELFKAACIAKGIPVTLNMREGYDHSYYFISSVIAEHIAYHVGFLASSGARRSGPL